MVNPIMADPRLALLQQALDGLSRREQTIAGNIANVDTPGYKRRDVPFEASLRASLGLGGVQLAATQPGHFSGPSSEAVSLLAGGTDTSAGTGVMRNDGNNIDIDYEMTQLAETALRYNLLTEATSSRFAMLRDIVGHS